ncbi:MAG: hypothetical protein ACKOGH_18355 [Alphaproteobacteria bacterium]
MREELTSRDFEIEALERRVRDLWTRVLILEDSLAAGHRPPPGLVARAPGAPPAGE